MRAGVCTSSGSHWPGPCTRSLTPPVRLLPPPRKAPACAGGCLGPGGMRVWVGASVSEGGLGTSRFYVTELIIHPARCGSLRGRGNVGYWCGWVCRVLKPDSELLRIGFQRRRGSGAGGLASSAPNAAWLPPGTALGGGGAISSTPSRVPTLGGFELFDWQSF